MVLSLPDVPPRDALDVAQVVLGAVGIAASGYAGFRAIRRTPNVPQRLVDSWRLVRRVNAEREHDPEVLGTILPYPMQFRRQGFSLAPSLRSNTRVHFGDPQFSMHELVLRWVESDYLPTHGTWLSPACRWSGARFVTLNVLDAIRARAPEHLLDAEQSGPDESVLPDLLERFGVVRRGPGRGRLFCRELAVFETSLQLTTVDAARTRFLALLEQFNTGRNGHPFDNSLTPITAAHIVGITHQKDVDRAVSSVASAWERCEPNGERLYVLGRGPQERMLQIAAGIANINESVNHRVRDKDVFPVAGNSHALRLAIVPDTCR